MNPQPWAPGEFPWLDSDLIAPGVRVIIDNDFAGDPDDLFQLVHHLMSPAVDVRGVVASHLAPGDPFDGGPETAADGAARLRELFNVMGFAGEELIWEGAETALVDRTTPRDSPGARKIVAEALRDDPRPLYLCVGGGLTETASAWLLEPRIAQRLTVIWIGGPEHPGTVAEPPGVGNPEYNLNIDLLAGQVLFNDSDLPLWQVPRNVYRQCLVSDIELRNRVQSRGELGRYLLEAIRAVWRQPGRTDRGFAETYALGDSPLVLLTALQSMFEPDPCSSDHVVVPAPRLDDHGHYVRRPDGRPIRVYQRLDVRLMFEDLFGKLDAFARWRDEPGPNPIESTIQNHGS